MKEHTMPILQYQVLCWILRKLKARSFFSYLLKKRYLLAIMLQGVLELGTIFIPHQKHCRKIPYQ
jgi:hypothetical protein